MKFAASTKPSPQRLAAKPRTGSYLGIQRAADRKAPAFKRLYIETIQSFRESLSIPAIVDAFTANRLDRIYAMFQPGPFSAADGTVAASLQTVATLAGRASQLQMRVRKADDDDPELPLGGASVELVFNVENTAGQLWARRQAGRLIQDVDTESLAVVQDVIAEGLRTGEDYGRRAQRIKDAVGLNRRQAGALERYRLALEEAQLVSARVERQTNRYRERLLKARAETIARTETIAASNQGAMMYWETLVQDGTIPRERAFKVWVVTPDDRLCPICEPLAGKEVPLADSFVSKVGMVNAPPAHPNCRCALSLRIAT